MYFDQAIPPLKNLFCRNIHTHFKRPMCTRLFVAALLVIGKKM